MGHEKRAVNRYDVECECILAFETGRKFHGQILDLSSEGAKIAIEDQVPIKSGDILYLNIKCQYKIKLKARVQWTKINKVTFVGIKFLELSVQDHEALSKLLSEIVLSRLTDEYFK